RIRLSFPLASVIQQVMVFRCAEQLFALPMQSVQSVGEANSTLRGVDLAAVLGGRPNDASQRRQPIVLARQPSAPLPCTPDAQPVTLLVDEVIGREQVVVRPLPALLKSHPWCSGATLSQRGQIVLLLDV